jgi:hypothetical protein
MSDRNWCDVRKAGRTNGVSQPVTYDPGWRRRRWHRLPPADIPGRGLPVPGNVTGRFRPATTGTAATVRRQLVRRVAARSRQIWWGQVGRP